jgi:hypothetical protein
MSATGWQWSAGFDQNAIHDSQEIETRKIEFVFPARIDRTTLRREVVFSLPIDVYFGKAILRQDTAPRPPPCVSKGSSPIVIGIECVSVPLPWEAIFLREA